MLLLATCFSGPPFVRPGSDDTLGSIPEQGRKRGRRIFYGPQSIPESILQEIRSHRMGPYSLCRLTGAGEDRALKGRRLFKPL